ncbi:MAG TPA: polyprenyl synthetase family protein [Polyangia bacterium]|nr:polyprenyl synthetase family protein [Polyangia bacterium]
MTTSAVLTMMHAMPEGHSSSCSDRAAALVATELRQVEARLAERMESPIGPIPRVGAHLLDAGGKRLRPLLAVLAARAAGVSTEMGVAVGCAAELIHTATLYHDDVVDDGRVRRGRPAARMVYGNGIVVLVGDFCLARALETVALTGVLPVVQSLAATVTEMAEGEVAQLERAGNPDATIDEYFRVIDRKTASLLAWCARVGGTVGPALDEPLGRYGRALGQAFQIADDVLDSAVDEATAGKSVGHDIQEGKLTLPVLLACEADATLRQRVRGLVGEKGVSAEMARELLLQVRAAGGVERARQKAQQLAESAVVALETVPPSPYREALRDLAFMSADRKS